MSGADSSSDLLPIGGSVNGTTKVLVNDTNSGPGAYNPTGILFAHADGANPGTFKLQNGPIDKGFFNCVPSSADDLMRSLLRDYNRTKIESLSQSFFDMDDRTGQRDWQDIFHYACKKAFQPLMCNLRAMVHNWAGEQFFRIGDLEKALYSFWNAAKTDSNSTEYYNNCAAVCSHLGKAAHAANCIEKALQIDPDDPRTLRNFYELRNAGVNVDSRRATNDSLPDQFQCIKTP